MALPVVVAAAFLLATTTPSTPRAAPVVAASTEEFLWRSGYWYCAHFAVNGRDDSAQQRGRRPMGKTLTVRRSEVAEGPVLVSARGTIAELPRLFALEIEREAPELGPVRAAEVQCYHFTAGRNLNAQVERQSGIGSTRLLYRGEPLAKVTTVTTVPGFAPSALSALKRWKPPAGSTIYQARAIGRDRAAWPDECLARPGYAQFVDELRSAVAKRDAAGLRSLFAADGRMRLNGIGGTRNFPDWGLERPEAAGIWPALEEILRLGCASRGQRLYLPFMAAREEGADDDVLVAVEDTAIRSSPAPTARTVGLASRGSTLQSLGAAAVEDWAHVAAADGSTGYVPGKSLRSPSSTMLVLANEQGTWRIRWFGGNI